MKKLQHLILRKCKSLSRQLKRSSSYTSLRSNSTKERSKYCGDDGETIYVGSSRRRYIVNSNYLTHPLINALIEKSKQSRADDGISIECEVVLFDHLLWMLENGDPCLRNTSSNESLDELVDLYVQ
ncbi:auxin-responsive protein SAUR76 [Amaranthus tricolor]|uniref:auxin-responsive protein SAUR76 n=1 Tax=Amaranthus tricolor TaxID=29722 RepID=UPI0025842A21|nr:auxin-responsive protein SAUR76 [Amaranthus tricolor]